MELTPEQTDAIKTPAQYTNRFVMFTEANGQVVTIAFGRMPSFHSAIAVTPDNAIALVELVLQSVRPAEDQRERLINLLKEPTQ